ncbi:MAG: GntR family transcriptional regulator [Nocardiopsaceae bacterium]|nr:GntR family transcriptional regulator [Nocardiopsaceae bacterium]
MPVIPADRSYPEDIRTKLEELDAEFPEREFWQTPVYMGPDSWSSRPIGATSADIICHSPEAMRAALEDAGDKGQIKKWMNSEIPHERIAGEFLALIEAGRLAPWDALPDNKTAADDYGVSERTVIRAKALLAEHGKAEKSGGLYVVAKDSAP